MTKRQTADLQSKTLIVRSLICCIEYCIGSDNETPVQSNLGHRSTYTYLINRKAGFNKTNFLLSIQKFAE